MVVPRAHRPEHEIRGAEQRDHHRSGEMPRSRRHRPPQQHGEDDRKTVRFDEPNRGVRDPGENAALRAKPVPRPSEIQEDARRTRDTDVKRIRAKNKLLSRC